MISILIPTYNYNVLPLVTELHKQAENLKINFEVLVYDDCSPNPLIENEAINDLSYSKYAKLSANIGRSAIRNKLANDSKYENLLFLDADTQIVKKDFIDNYLQFIISETQIIYGGIIYQTNPPKKAELLRWIYGNKREALPVSERIKQPHLRFLTLNFLIKKSVFTELSFNEEIPNLRHEDTLFALDSKKKNINIQHIENPVIHLGLEDSSIFLRKSEESVQALKLFIEQGLIEAEETSLSKKAEQLKHLKLSFLAKWFYKIFSKQMKKNLLSSNPSLLIFDLYRLGYYCSIK